MCDIVWQAGADYIKTSTAFPHRRKAPYLPRCGADVICMAAGSQAAGWHLHRGGYGKVPAPRRPSGHLSRSLNGRTG